MRLSDFRVGGTFWCAERLWRCTDVGTRVVVAIRVDEVTVASLKDGMHSERTMGGHEAQIKGLFNGPPYAVAETVFDEDDREACSLERDGVG